MRGTAVMVPVLEANSKARIGRFGWKSQHASLESFSADAYLNEMGITTPLLPDENLSDGADISYSKSDPYDPVPDPRTTAWTWSRSLPSCDPQRLRHADRSLPQ